jgi:mRNA interferase RelE/StbE
MKEYEIIYYSKAEKDLSKINKKEAKVIFQKISQLKNDPHPQMSIKLKGYDYNRLRVGNYRVIYQIDEIKNKVTVISIKHRSEVYLNL